MEERETAAITFEPAPEIRPAGDLVDRLVLNQPFQHQRRRTPVDSLQVEETAIEPRSKQVQQVVVQGGPCGMGRQLAADAPAHFDEGASPAGRDVEAAEQLL